jgi:hypothetical protein
LRNLKDFSRKQPILLLLEVQLEDLLHSSGLIMLEKRLKLRMFMLFQIQEYSLIPQDYRQANTHIVILSLISLNFPTQMEVIQLHNVLKLTLMSFGDACSLNNYTNTLKFHYSQSNLYMTLGQSQTFSVSSALHHNLYQTAPNHNETSSNNTVETHQESSNQ